LSDGLLLTACTLSLFRCSDQISRRFQHPASCVLFVLPSLIPRSNDASSLPNTGIVFIPHYKLLITITLVDKCYKIPKIIKKNRIQSEQKCIPVTRIQEIPFRTVVNRVWKHYRVKLERSNVTIQFRMHRNGLATTGQVKQVTYEDNWTNKRKTQELQLD
jgi:hypothetical protein